jgi:sigma-B regulation protein RsbU (phosphoserine phosphatase)
MALGVDADWPYETRSARLNPGESVVLYSDGVVDAMDRLGNRFGVPQTRETLRLARALSPEELVETLLARVHRHRGNCEQNDDISMVVFRRNAIWDGAGAGHSQA